MSTTLQMLYHRLQTPNLRVSFAPSTRRAQGSGEDRRAWTDTSTDVPSGVRPVEAAVPPPGAAARDRAGPRGARALGAAGGRALPRRRRPRSPRPTLRTATLQAVADTMIPGRKAARTDLGNEIHPKAIAGRARRAGRRQADALRLYHDPLIGFDALAPAFLSELAGALAAARRPVPRPAASRSAWRVRRRARRLQPERAGLGGRRGGAVRGLPACRRRSRTRTIDTASGSR